MSESEKNLKKIASLAYIQLNESETSHLSNDIEHIMQFVETLQSIDTQGVEPMLHPLDMKQRLRADTATETNHERELSSMAPAFEEGHFLVPKVIDAGSR